MKTIHIKHPLRDIVYQLKDEYIYSSLEEKALDEYRKAHDEVWQMKILLEKERGDVLLNNIQIDLFENQRQELQKMFDFYEEQIDMSQTAPIANIDIQLQVELRGFYVQTAALHKTLVRFYDQILVNTEHYGQYIDTYFKKEKPIDPLNFTVLEDIFLYHDDMQVDIVSLDKDLQNFLKTLTQVYELLDDYIMQYNELYTHYGKILQSVVALTKCTQRWNSLWENS